MFSNARLLISSQKPGLKEEAVGETLVTKHWECNGQGSVLQLARLTLRVRRTRGKERGGEAS